MRDTEADSTPIEEHKVMKEDSSILGKRSHLEAFDEQNQDIKKRQHLGNSQIEDVMDPVKAGVKQEIDYVVIDDEPDVD